MQPWVKGYRRWVLIVASLVYITASGVIQPDQPLLVAHPLDKIRATGIHLVQPRCKCPPHRALTS